MLGRIDLQLLGPPVGQALTPRINEGEVFRVTVRPLNADLAATTPTLLRYRIDDMDRGAPILGWTDLVAGTLVNVIVTATQNTIRNGLNLERRRMIFEARDADGGLRKTLDFDVVNLGLQQLALMSEEAEPLYEE